MPNVEISNISVRQFVMAEEPDIAPVAKELLADLYQDRGPDAYKKCCSYTEKEICYRADVGEQPVGIATALTTPESSEVIIRRVIVARKFRGQSVGSVLLSRLEQDALAEGKQRASLYALDKKSVKFYRQLGYWMQYPEPTYKMVKKLVV